MPNVIQQDMSYQPAQKPYAFSDNPSSPGTEEKKQQNNGIVLLLLEIIGLIVVFVVFLLILNYFKIISLPMFIRNQQSNMQSQSPSPSPTPVFTPVVDTSLITTEDSAAKISLYRTFAVPVPYYSDADKSWMIGGVLAGYGKNAILVISSNNTLIFNLAANTILETETVNNNQSSSGATIEFAPYTDINAFIKDASFGKYVQVYYNQGQTASNKTATKIDYLPLYTF